MSTIFKKIITGELPAYKIKEDENYLAFLDINPLVEGHCLVIPKLEVDNIFDLQPEIYKGLFYFSRQIAKAIELSFNCKKVGIAVVGLEVPHAHIHLIPINEVKEMNFSNPKLKLEKNKLEEIMIRIKSNLNDGH